MSLCNEPSFRLIAPFLRPVMGLLDDDSVSEVMVNPGAVFVERGGMLERVAGVVLDPKHVRQAALAIARSQGDDISAERPLLDARLPDGSRIAAALPPCSFGGPALTIRKFARRRLALDDLVASASLSEAVAQEVRRAVDERRNILVSGGTGTGKTTLLAAIARLIPADERVVTIEDTVELQLDHPNLVRFEARRQTDGAPAVTVRDLVRAALRHRPDRIVLGEVRGGEAWDLLQALNTGHDGSLSTLHASSAANALKRCTSWRPAGGHRTAVGGSAGLGRRRRRCGVAPRAARWPPQGGRGTAGRPLQLVHPPVGVPAGRDQWRIRRF